MNERSIVKLKAVIALLETDPTLVVYAGKAKTYLESLSARNGWYGSPGKSFFR